MVVPAGNYEDNNLNQRNKENIPKSSFSKKVREIYVLANFLDNRKENNGSIRIRIEIFLRHSRYMEENT